ncbi:acetolactate synthase large subunit [Thiobacillus denitrificans ATCC 25259]|uniref:Acetolactate synthase large subunit n=1 Tax=Thiobacillus denitrificans (strain ATCC 25259 / T1) TaxID=292415 RepID=Q3SL06_THIDA|nr:thiamine pyrophosphate-binding protein [Thiobacillus denitrificans]AAZ96615.1 acetolactate synthase large subunit [Thiobacillus denitrificans ATCC 25259]
MNISVSELIVRYLERLGIGHVFGMPGAHILPIYDRLRDASLRTVLVKHEQGAAFMAGGEARVARRPSACIATSGPGATNLITGIANAYAERLPVLAITGETSTYIFGRGGLQESSGEGGAIDQGALFASITRYHKRIERTDYLGQALNQATQALLGREPGPVLLSIPYNVQKESVDAGALEQVHFPRAEVTRHTAAVSELAALIADARAPVIVAGYGCIAAGARELVGTLSEKFRIPVTSSLKAKGVVTEGSDLSLGCLGVTSNGDAYRYLAEHADLLVFLGASFNERTSYLWDAELLARKKIAQVDRDPAQLGRVFQPDVAVCGDIRAVVEDLLAALATSGAAPKKTERLARHRAGLKRPTQEAAPENEGFQLIRHFFHLLAKRFPREALVFDDNIVFAQSYFDVSDRNRYFPNTGISSLGHALPAAIGARCHAKDSPAFAILGDGGFQMCCMEMMTAVNYGIPLNVVVINNGTLSLIRKNQFQLYGERYIDCDFTNPDFALLARSFGVAHYRVANEAELDAVFADADLIGGINLIEILLDKNAFPRYLAGR